jgi:hypothetical protein
MTPSLTRCSKCGREFPPGTPEPSWCPDCGRLCTGYAERKEIELPLPEEMPVTPEERAHWWMWFWVFFLLGPLFAIASWLIMPGILSTLPPSLRPYREINSHGFVPLCLGAAGAGYCLANLCFKRRRFADILPFSFVFGIVVMAAYWGIVALALALVFSPIFQLTLE